jgi:hypothetical protein
MFYSLSLQRAEPPMLRASRAIVLHARQQLV